ncbi:MAG: glycerophosphodiester phosphodiesterase family protein [Candidatus Solibacter usitatus]|nr:glycerophosphodiester phosphodiesterase family protein [Candidatus Solibacter usitatus]
MKPLLLAVVVIAHRGEHIHHTENTLAAFQAALDAGADYYEVDVRTTSDGKLVLMHDATVDRTTNGKGAVAEMSFDQVRALRTKDGSGVPTFEEALSLARGHGGVYVDVKRAAAADLLAALDRQKMTDHVVVYGGFDYLRQLQSLRPSIKVMPESVSVAMTRKIVEELKPKVIAFSARDWTDDIIAVARAGGADLYVDRLGSADNPAAWQDAIHRGAAGIQTDKPGELVRFLRAKGLHR